MEQNVTKNTTDFSGIKAFTTLTLHLFSLQPAGKKGQIWMESKSENVAALCNIVVLITTKLQKCCNSNTWHPHS